MKCKELVIYCGLALCLAANTSVAHSKKKYYSQLSAGFSTVKNVPNLNMQGGLATTRVPLRWGYRLGLGWLINPGRKTVYGLEIAAAQYVKNKWVFSPLGSEVEQDLKGLELLLSARRNLTPLSTIVAKLGAVCMIQDMTTTNIFATPTRFTFQYTGTEKKLKPMVALELDHVLNASWNAFINMNYVFANDLADVTMAPGAAPTLAANGIWRKMPSMYNVNVGLSYHF